MASNLQGKIINFLGDSITQGAAATAPEKRYVNVIASRALLKRANNYGIGGTRIARNATPSEEGIYDVDFISRVEIMDKEADIIFVFGGTNDYGHGTAPLGVVGDETEYTFYGACRVLLKKLRAQFPQAKLAVATPLRRVHDDSPYGEYKKEAVAPLKVYRDILLEVARDMEVPVLDLYTDETLNATNEQSNAAYFFDGLHPNDKGHSVLADKIIAFLETL